MKRVKSIQQLDILEKIQNHISDLKLFTKKWTALIYVITEFIIVKKILDFKIVDVVLTFFYSQTKKFSLEGKQQIIT